MRYHLWVVVDGHSSYLEAEFEMLADAAQAIIDDPEGRAFWIFDVLESKWIIGAEILYSWALKEAKKKEEVAKVEWVKEGF